MKRLIHWAMLAVLIGAGGVAKAQIYTKTDYFNDGLRPGYGGECIGNVDETNSLLRISRNNDYYADYYHQWINVVLGVPGPYYEFDVGVLCNSNDYLRIEGMVKAPHRIGLRGQRYQIGIGFLNYAENEIGLMVQDSLSGRRLVATCLGSTVKSASLAGDTSLNRLWLKITYSAATQRLTYYWAPYTLILGKPGWIKFCGRTLTGPSVTDGECYLDPSMLGHIYGPTCPPQWNVGLHSCALYFENK